ncbi:unnamed protein product [Spirodela intermedia]|uniref:Uncharacterized protein n=1 Tax=Spirodela intermedia TaxID=51605 RepID=A0A7I8LLC4_SPIIN|nr:unnamed protein product [Spirodela intermedia]
MPVLPASIAGGAHLAGEAAVIAAAAVLSSYLSLPSRLLEGVHTYIHPDNIGTGDGLRAAIRQPSDDASSTEQPQLKRRSRSERDGGAVKGKSPFDESGAQLLRLRLVDSHLRTRLYFPEYRRSFVSSISAVSCLLLGIFLSRRSSSDSDPPSVAEAAVPVFSSLFAAAHVFSSLAKVSFERSATKRSERQLAALSGFIGFVSALLIRYIFSPSIFDFRFPGGAVGFWGITSSALAGCLAGFLFVPAIRAARSLWLGTDQLRWNLDGAMSSGKISPILLSAAFVAGVVAPLMWIKPIVDFPARNSSPAKFDQFRIWLLAASATLQLLAVRPNLQTYLNEAVLSWYQMLHSSKIPDSDFARAKVFLHNHNLCLVVLQFFAIPALEMLLLGISQTTARSSGGALLPDFASTAKETALFFAWWISFVWAMYTISTLALLRCGFLLIS